tara:strand:- start:3006 stop:4187 length:1182 start_codon:yes stop_codon:yes gene_type:complete
MSSSIFSSVAKNQVKNCFNIHDLRNLAKQRAHKMVFDYLDSGADDEITKKNAENAYHKTKFNYKVLSGVDTPINLTTKLGNYKLGIPFFNCPTAGNKMFHVDGETAVAKIAQKYKTIYSISSLCTTPLETITPLHSHPKVFQLYLWKDKALLRDVIQKAKESKYNILALTADFGFYGKRERDLRNGFTIPPSYSINQIIEAIKAPQWTTDYLMSPGYTYSCLNNNVSADSLANFVKNQLNPAFSWNDAEYIINEWGDTGPVALKGVVRPDDAKIACDIGFDIMWISNHGARQLEHSVNTYDVLPEIRKTIGDNKQIILDGGIMRGTDIVKAIASGADAVGIGKAYLYGLTAGGIHGVDRAYEILIDEVERACGLLGVQSIEQLKKEGKNLLTI